MKGGRLESRSRSRSRSTGSRGASWSNKFDGIGGFQVGSWGGHATSLELLQLRLDDIDGLHDVVFVLLEGVFLCANRVESSAESAEVVAGVPELGFQFSLEHEILNLLLLLVQCFDLFSHEEDVVDNTIHFDFVLLEDQSYLLYPTAVVANLSALSDDVGLDLAQGTQKLFLFVTLFHCNSENVNEYITSIMIQKIGTTKDSALLPLRPSGILGEEHMALAGSGQTLERLHQG